MCYDKTMTGLYDKLINFDELLSNYDICLTSGQF